MTERYYSRFDKLLMQLDLVRKTLSIRPTQHERAYPTQDPEAALSEQERKHAAGLMRVNHAGEVCAQALYQGQALTARSATTVAEMQAAGNEELDHLAWCNQRLQELDSHASYLSVLWYLGALTMGVSAGLIGDRWNLGFLAETEQQVVQHLESHLAKLPEQDQRSRTIVRQMHEDEAKHRDMARDHGAANLPRPIKFLMKLTSRVMTKTAYWV